MTVEYFSNVLKSFTCQSRHLQQSCSLLYTIELKKASLYQTQNWPNEISVECKCIQIEWKPLVVHAVGDL